MTLSVPASIAVITFLTVTSIVFIAVSIVYIERHHSCKSKNKNIETAIQSANGQLEFKNLIEPNTTATVQTPNLPFPPKSIIAQFNSPFADDNGYLKISGNVHGSNANVTLTRVDDFPPFLGISYATFPVTGGGLPGSPPATGETIQTPQIIALSSTLNSYGTLQLQSENTYSWHTSNGLMAGKYHEKPLFVFPTATANYVSNISLYQDKPFFISVGTNKKFTLWQSTDKTGTNWVPRSDFSNDSVSIQTTGSNILTISYTGDAALIYVVEDNSKYKVVMFYMSKLTDPIEIYNSESNVIEMLNSVVVSSGKVYVGIGTIDSTNNDYVYKVFTASKIGVPFDTQPTYTRTLPETVNVGYYIYLGLITKDVVGLAQVQIGSSISISISDSSDTFRKLTLLPYTATASELSFYKVDFMFFNTTARIYLSGPNNLDGRVKPFGYIESTDQGKTWNAEITLISNSIQSNIGLCQLPNSEMALATWRYNDSIDEFSPTFTQLFGYLTNHTVDFGIFSK